MSGSSSSELGEDSGEEYDPKGNSNKKTSKKNVYNRIGFNEEDEEKLIELVKSNPCLYDVASHAYKDRLLRVKTWNDIAKDMSKNLGDCKKKWKNTKDQYERSRKKLPTGSGATSNQMKRMELLSFLGSFSTVNNKYVSHIFFANVNVKLICGSLFPSTVSNMDGMNDDSMDLGIESQASPMELPVHQPKRKRKTQFRNSHR